MGRSEKTGGQLSLEYGLSYGRASGAWPRPAAGRGEAQPGEGNGQNQTQSYPRVSALA